MDCKQFQEILPELLTGSLADSSAGREGATPEVEEHLAACGACSGHLAELKKTMALLDEWTAPEPSAYFDTRLEARLREEMARPRVAWYERLLPGLKHHPGWLTSVAAVIFVAAVAIGNKSYIVQTDEIATNPPALTAPVQPGTAVGDLQALEKNDDLYADFDMLDDLQVQDTDVTATP